jgi:hypothetical protein
MNLSDDVLREHRIILAVIAIAVGTTLTYLGLDSVITLLTGAACGYLVKLFTEPQKDADQDGAEERVIKG